MSDFWFWLALATLGAYHGLNPAMGWLFAVARGLQERKRGAVLQALPPIALGHAASSVLVIGLVGGLELVAGAEVWRPAAAVILILFGVYRFLRPGSHPRWVGMRVSRPELALWSFLMSTAHGAGLMLLPLLLGSTMPAAGPHDHPVGPGASAVFLAQGTLAVLVHTLSMFAVMALAAVVVYERLGVVILRQAWLNLHTLWALTLVLAGVLTLVT